LNGSLASSLSAAGPQPGGLATAVGAFLLCGALIVLAGLVRPLGRLIAAIPAPIAGAMLAGVLLPPCLAPVKAVAEVPLLAVPVAAVWAVVLRFARPWAVPAALAAAAAGIVATGPGLGGADLAPPSSGPPRASTPRRCWASGCRCSW
jgi:benzoate membrane transport protein